MAAKLFTQHGEEVRMQDGTTGSVLFLNAAGQLTEDNASIIFNDTTNVLTTLINAKQSVEPHGFHNLQNSSVAAGTDTACATNTQFVSSVFIPVNKTITGIAYLVGSTGGTDKAYGVLYDASGTALAFSSTTSGGVTVGSAASVTAMDLTATYAAKGPAMFYVGVSVNGATAKIRTVPANLSSGIYGGTVTQTHGTVGNITPPTTFTANTAPYLYVY